MEKLIGTIVAGKYQIEKKIGKGSFGDIFRAMDLKTKEKVAIKVESADHDYPQLVYEKRIYDSLRGGPGIPYLYWYGTEDGLNFLVMDLLGPSLESLFDQCSRKFSLKTLLLIAQQTITRVEFMHSQHFIHRDIKPENFVIGLGNRSQYIYIIDYGLCKKFFHWREEAHIPYIEGKALTGTARYASINTHLGIEQSRRDDLECLGYVFIYLLLGKLPWQDINLPEKADRYEAIKNMKIQTSVRELCEGLPTEFATFTSYARSLRFEETPDYGYLKQLFEGLAYRMKCEENYVFDWNQINIINEDEENIRAPKRINNNLAN
jgi:serine/threonine protein kinase